MIYVDRSRVTPPKQYITFVRGEQQKVLETRRWPEEAAQKARGLIYPALNKLFHGKCAYCETPIENQSHGDIERFRPIRNAAGLDERKVDPDHYLWLGFLWDNLYLSCANCHRQKRNLFPIAGHRARFGASEMDLAKEDVLLVDPCAEDPAVSLKFTASGKVSPMDERGEVTIKVLGLNRRDLKNSRAQIWKECNRRRASNDTLALRKMSESAAPYAAVARAFAMEFSPNVSMGPAAAPKTERKEPRKKKRTAKRKREIRQKAKLLEAVWIDEIDISNFCAIRSCNLIFPEPDLDRPDESESIIAAEDEEISQPWLMLIGRNGVGKSSILKAIAIALTPTAKRRKYIPDASKCVNREAIAERKREKKRGKVHGHVRLTFTNGESVALLFKEGCSEFESEGRRPPSLQAVGYSSTRLPAGGGRAPPDSTSRIMMENLLNPFIPLSDVNRWLADVSNLRSTPFRVLSEGIADLLSYPPDSKAISRRSGQLLAKGAPFDELSDGYRSLAGLATDLMRHLSVGGLSAKNFVGTVLLDEIETHLHPEWKLKIVETLRRVFPHVRFIVATHDPLCLRGLLPGEIHRLIYDSEQEQTILRRMDVPAGLDAAELLTGNWFGLSSTLDRGTRSLIEKQRQLSRKRQTGKVREEIKKIRDELRVRLYGSPTATSIERTVTDLVLQEYDKEIHEFTPDDRKTLHAKLQKRLSRARQRN